ncbi:MAG: hypothetical protein LQ338_003055 [Usnochroma carphineum]|nr:MAG: hypothetical protein LQ338_003055 [Usnochroma carphineum]
MNGFADHGLDDNAFGEKTGGFRENIRTFDAFPKTKPTYTRRTSTGGYTTLVLIFASLFLSISEFLRWYRGHETHLFSVEKGVSHQMQINLDIVVPMYCYDLHINVQDASGDRILAGELLNKDPTNWAHWIDASGTHRLAEAKYVKEEEEDTHVGHVLGEVGGKRKKRFKKTPSVGRGTGAGRSCRIYGSIEGNKVQGDFHITARGHGYAELAEHLDHNAFNFSHMINELSFGPLYPSLLNPLDRTYATTDDHFYKYQYYLSVVPTVYTRSPSPPPTNPDQPLPNTPLPPDYSNRNTIITNQYAATSQSHPVNERTIPGIFFKFDIEPILLTVREEREGLLWLLVRVVNVVSGVLVGGGWCYQLGGWAREVLRKGRRGRGGGEGMLNGRVYNDDEGEEE